MDLKEATALRLEPGATYALEVNDRISNEVMERLSRQAAEASKKFNIRLVVLPPGTKIAKSSD